MNLSLVVEEIAVSGLYFDSEIVKLFHFDKSKNVLEVVLLFIFLITSNVTGVALTSMYCKIQVNENAQNSS